MSDKDWSEELTAYIDGELTDAERAALESRLAGDAQLRALEHTLRRTIEAMKTLEAPQPSPALRRAVLAGIAAPTWRERVGAWLTPGRLVPMGALAAAGVAAVVVLSRDPQPAMELESEEQLLVAQNIDLLEDLDVVGLEQPDDLDVVASLHELTKETP